MQENISLIAHRTDINGCSQAERLADVLSVKDLDAAMDGAARRSHATIAEYLAAPLPTQNAGAEVSLGLAIEFFVPPATLESFARYLETNLRKCSPEYALDRDRHIFAPLSLHTVPSGTFHQWRMSWHGLQVMVPQKRWQSDRYLVDSILWQASMGWKD